MRVLLTGGGTAGHVTPNIALMPALKEAGYQIEEVKEQGSWVAIRSSLL